MNGDDDDDNNDHHNHHQNDKNTKTKTTPTNKKVYISKRPERINKWPKSMTDV
jgi:hypothetical protein